MKKIILISSIFITTLSIYYYVNKEKIFVSRFENCQWDLYKSDYKLGYNDGFHKVGVYEFSWDGGCEYYLHDKKKNKLFKYQADDIEIPNRWAYVNDSTFDINGGKYKILYFKKDSIVLLWNNPNWLDTLILVPSPIRIKIGKSNGGVDSR
jgi:hypothetical protein